MPVEYIIKTGPEELRKTDYCFDCDQIMVSGEKIYIVGFGNLPSKWGKVHEKCAELSQHWDLWSQQQITLLVGKSSAVKIEKSHNVIVLEKGTYTGKIKYAVIDKDGNTIYQTSRAERAAGVEEFLNEWK